MKLLLQRLSRFSNGQAVVDAEEDGVVRNGRLLKDLHRSPRSLLNPNSASDSRGKRSLILKGFGTGLAQNALDKPVWPQNGLIMFDLCQAELKPVKEVEAWTKPNQTSKPFKNGLTASFDSWPEPLSATYNNSHSTLSPIPIEEDVVCVSKYVSSYILYILKGRL